MSYQEFKQQLSGIIAKRNFALAEQLCREAENTIPGPELLFIRGVLYSAKGDLEKALSYLLQAYQAQPGRSDIAYNYGVVLHESGNIAEAVRAWKRATSLGPNNAAAWINLALGTIQLGKDKAAVEVYRRALKHHPANRDLLYNYANHLCRLGDLTQGEAVYTTLLNIHPKDALAWINLGMVLKSSSSLLKNLEISSFSLPRARVSGDVFDRLRRFVWSEQPLAYAATSLGIRIRL